jgi:serine/threonine protein phosphatase PrpC
VTPAQTAPSSSLIVSVGVQCHPGGVRTENQDRISRASTSFGDLYVVADGVGGYERGAEAAQETVDGLARGLASHATLPRADALKATIQAINRELDLRGHSQNPPVKMSSTVVIALIHGSIATIAHVGDSRAYLARNGKLQQITRDHSVVQRLIDQGVVAAADAGEHPNASVLTQALGQSAEVQVDIVDLDILPGDALLLCSDGLWGYANAVEMETVVTSANLSPSGCAEALLNLALQGGGGDNISIQFLKFSSPAIINRPPRIFGMSPRLAVPVAGLAIAFVAAAGISIWNLRHRPHKNIEMPDTTPVATLPPKPLPASPAIPQTKAKKSRLVFIRDDGRQAEWAAKLSKVASLEVSWVKGEDACLTLEKDHATIYYKPSAEAEALLVKRKLALESQSLLKMDSEHDDCGAGDLFAFPAKRTAIDAIKEKTRKTVGDKLPKIGDK